jgi:hypothetical protein
MLAFAIALALQYRVFNNIKAIYIYPAIPAMSVLFIIGWNTLDGWFLNKKPVIKSLLRVALVILIGLYAMDSIALFLQLYI